MMDLLEDERPGRNEPEYTVSEISGAVKRTIEGQFGRVRIRGECGRVMVARSGHVYLDLKDERAVLSSVIWKGQAARMTVRPEEGMEVVATGKLTTFPGQSRYQMVIEDIRPAGVGALMAMFEQRKARLKAEGLFDPACKAALPYLPRVIGVVTSPQGAVIRDILHRLRDRFPSKVLIWPVAVQGEACAPQVTAAISGFNALSPGGALPRPDVLIVARGGGSIEDLWGFNEESVARAAAASQIPLISAVGHETDTTLIDYVSDRRAPTPSAAAEMAVPVRLELMATLESYDSRMARLGAQMIAQRRQRLRDLARALPQRQDLVQRQAQRFDLLAARLPSALHTATSAARVRFEKASAPLRPALLERMGEQRQSRLMRASDQLSAVIRRRCEQSRARLDRHESALTPLRLTRELKRQQERLERSLQRAVLVGRHQVKNWRHRLERLEGLRQTLGYQATLDRGYAVVWQNGQVVTHRADAARAGRLEIQFRDGRVSVAAQPSDDVAATSPQTSGTPPDKAARRTGKPRAKGQSPAQKGLFDE